MSLHVPSFLLHFNSIIFVHFLFFLPSSHFAVFCYVFLSFISSSSLSGSPCIFISFHCPSFSGPAPPKNACVSPARKTILRIRQLKSANLPQTWGKWARVDQVGLGLQLPRYVTRYVTQVLGIFLLGIERNSNIC